MHLSSYRAANAILILAARLDPIWNSLRSKRSVGFQSAERSKNEILIILPRKKWERVKKWSEGGGGRE